jgi:cytochrome c
VVALLAAAAISLGGGAIHLAGDVRHDGGGAALRGVPVDPQARDILERSCANCHSEHVRWPWYSRLAPASWLLEHDVSQARSRMNLSQWGRYSTQEQEAILAAIGAAARRGEMPPRRFTLLHPDAALTPGQRERLYQWSKEERRRLRRAEHL